LRYANYTETRYVCKKNERSQMPCPTAADCLPSSPPDVPGATITRVSAALQSSSEGGQVFRQKADSDSEASRTVIPIDLDRPETLKRASGAEIGNPMTGPSEQGGRDISLQIVDVECGKYERFCGCGTRAVRKCGRCALGRSRSCRD
jgi:hypothetical protein